MQILDRNGLSNIEYAEPFAGGAAVALALLLEDYASTIYINDLSRPVYAFWHTVLNATSELCRRVEQADLTVGEWRRQRAVYNRRHDADLEELGFATLYLNRTNRSGIVSGGLIGGYEQSGEWGIDARFNRADLIQRIRRIGRYRSRIQLFQLDARVFVRDVVTKLKKGPFVFLDPPYIEKGEDLYLNDYLLDDHRELARQVSNLNQHWMVTYDPPADDAGLFPNSTRITYGLPYTANLRYEGKEMMFLDGRLRLPVEWTKHEIFSLAPARSRHPLLARLRTPA